MRGLLRNKRAFWYCLFLDTAKPVDPEPEPAPDPEPEPEPEPIDPVEPDDTEPETDTETENGGEPEPAEPEDPPEENRILDENGYETGEIISRYAEPVQMKAMITSATGQIRTEPFGTYEDYDRIIVTAWTDCPIDENTVLFIDKEPEFTEVPSYDVEESSTLFGNDTITPVTYRQPMYDYRVVRVSRGINGARIFIHKAATT